MARKGSEGTKVPRQGKAFHIPADIRASGSDAVIVNAMRREHYALKRNKAPSNKGK